MPAPAVIPALVAYINTVVVKTLVVDLRALDSCSRFDGFPGFLCYNESLGFYSNFFSDKFFRGCVMCTYFLSVLCQWFSIVKALCNCKQIRVLKAGIVEAFVSFCLDDLAWDCFIAVIRLVFRGLFLHCANNVKQGEGSRTMVLEVKFRYHHMSI